jgi:hypothetical protein
MNNRRAIPASPALRVADWRKPSVHLRVANKFLSTYKCLKVLKKCRMDAISLPDESGLEMTITLEILD